MSIDFDHSCVDCFVAFSSHLKSHDSQLGITFGRGVGMIFKDGVPMRKVAGEDIVEAFVKETEKSWPKAPLPDQMYVMNW